MEDSGTLLTLCRIIKLNRLAQALAMGLVVFCVAFLAACGDDQDTQATGEPRLAAASPGRHPYRHMKLEN